MMVDDEPTTMELVQAFLEDSGYRKFVLLEDPLRALATMEAEEAGFEVGTRTIVNVLDATRENFLARLNYARARYLYVVDQLRLKRAACILSRDDMLDVNNDLDLAKSGP
jgi:hypothetical protein